MFMGNLGEVQATLGGVGEIIGLDYQTPRSWRALFAQSGKEQKSADWLREMQVRAYWPNYSDRDSQGGRNGRLHRRWRLRALIPGYLFIAVKANIEVDLTGLVDHVPGLFGFMRDGTGIAASVRESDIQRIRQIEADHNTPKPQAHVHKFEIDQKVRFKIDTGIWGKIIELCSDGRISIEAKKLLGGATVKAWPYQIEPM